MSLDELVSAQLAAALERALPGFADRVAELVAQKQVSAPRPAPPQPPGKPLGLQAAAQRLGISPSTLRAHVRAGRIHFTRPGGKLYRFSEEDLAAFERAKGPGVDFAEQSLRNRRRAAGKD